MSDEETAQDIEKNREEMRFKFDDAQSKLTKSIEDGLDPKQALARSLSFRVKDGESYTAEAIINYLIGKHQFPERVKNLEADSCTANSFVEQWQHILPKTVELVEKTSSSEAVWADNTASLTIRIKAFEDNLKTRYDTRDAIDQQASVNRSAQERLTKLEARSETSTEALELAIDKLRIQWATKLSDVMKVQGPNAEKNRELEKLIEGLETRSHEHEGFLEAARAMYGTHEDRLNDLDDNVIEVNVPDDGEWKLEMQRRVVKLENLYKRDATLEIHERLDKLEAIIKRVDFETGLETHAVDHTDLLVRQGALDSGMNELRRDAGERLNKLEEGPGETSAPARQNGVEWLNLEPRFYELKAELEGLKVLVGGNREMISHRAGEIPRLDRAERRLDRLEAREGPETDQRRCLVLWDAMQALQDLHNWNAQHGNSNTDLAEVLTRLSAEYLERWGTHTPSSIQWAKNGSKPA